MDQRGGDPRWRHAEHDWETTEAEVDPWAHRTGGMRNLHTDVEYGGGGHYTEIERLTRLAFTWIWDGDTTRQLIELDFEEIDGTTTAASPTAAAGRGGRALARGRLGQGSRQPRAHARGRPAQGGSPRAFQMADGGVDRRGPLGYQSDQIARELGRFASVDRITGLWLLCATGFGWIA